MYCTDFEINRYKIDEVRKYANIAFYLIYLTSHDAKTLHPCVMGTCDTSDRYFDKKHFEITQKSLRLPVQTVMAQIVVFVYSVTLTLTFDLCSIVCHTHSA